MRRYLIILITAVALASCFQNSVDEYYGITGSYDVSDMLFYDIDTGDYDSDYITSNSSSLSSVGIYGSKTGQYNWGDAEVTPPDYTLLDNLRLTYDGSSWNYDEGETATWGSPAATDKFSFFGYAPYQYRLETSDEWILAPVTDESYTTGYPLLMYDCPADRTLQSDVMLAEPVVDYYRPVHNHVFFTFHHATTCVGFQVRELAALTEISIDENGDSTLVEVVRQITKATIKNVYSCGVTYMDGDNISWVVSTAKGKRDYELGIQLPDIAEDGVTPCYTLSLDSPWDGFSTNFMSPDGYVMLIPQTLPSDAAIELTFASGETYTYSLSGTWSPNKRVVYNISIGAEEFDSVDIEPYEWEYTLIALTEDYMIPTDDVQNWVGSIVNSSYQGLSGDEEEETSGGGATINTTDWVGYIAPGFSYDIETGTTSSGGGATVIPDSWDLSVIFSVAISGEGSSSSSGGGATVDGSNWTDNIVNSATDTAEGEVDYSGGGSYVEGTDWDSNTVNTTTDGASSDTDYSGGGTYVESSDWDREVVNGATTGNESSSDSSGGGATVESDGWTQSNVIQTEEIIVTGTEVTTSNSGCEGNVADSWNQTVVVFSSVIVLADESTDTTDTTTTDTETEDTETEDETEDETE